MLVLLAENVKRDILANSSNSTWKLVGLILLCVIIIVACYYTTRFIGKRSQGGQGPAGKNIKALETFKVTQNKYLQLIKCGDKYLLIGVTKDNITVLSEIDGESLLTDTGTGHKSFKELITGLKGKGKQGEKSISELAGINLDDEVADVDGTSDDNEAGDEGNSDGKEAGKEGNSDGEKAGKEGASDNRKSDSETTETEMSDRSEEISDVSDIIENDGAAEGTENAGYALNDPDK